MQSYLRRPLQFALRRARMSTHPTEGYTWASKIPLTKIVATIGPASENFPVLQDVTASGMRIMRINFSHATYEEADLRTTNLRKCVGVHQQGLGSKDAGFNLRAIMLDTQGPEIRTGSFTEGIDGEMAGVQMELGAIVTVSVNPEWQYKQTTDTIFCSYTSLATTVAIDDRILLDDGAVELKVTEIHPNGNKDDIKCSVVNAGVLGNRKGVNLPGATIDLPPMSDKDRADIKWGIQNDVDFIAASFVRKASDIRAIRKYCSQMTKDVHRVVHDGEILPPKIIAKVENVEALKNLDEIISEADGVMVARGDLGVEIPMQTLTNIQKDIVKKCNIAGKPVIVATQMLESMQKNPRPTRAECTDVSNAVLDGADCVMLSGESAKGKYPVVAVDTMAKLIQEAEGWISRQREIDYQAHGTQQLHKPIVPEITNHIDGMASAIVKASRNLRAKCIIVLSRNGNTCINISKFRPDVPIVSIVPSQKVGRFLQLHRGCHPVVASRDLSSTGDSERFRTAIDTATSLGFCKVGDTVIIVCYETAVAKLSPAVSMRVAKVTNVAALTSDQNATTPSNTIYDHQFTPLN
eukprot:TRINITY_DN53055_c0_g1_i1.p1 TRINITY_DN53055_c0_g1~~TRINITY_DN53055_c0_g1_i1.p1  ORF type:complete len:579 (-),score=-8.52 TRINITY_DN53055_c0_g1_i1:27-1763(-)